MSAEYTIEAGGLRHSVWKMIVGSIQRCHTDCGGYVNDVREDSGFLVVTCVRCLAAALRDISSPGEF